MRARGRGGLVTIAVGISILGVATLPKARAEESAPQHSVEAPPATKDVEPTEWYGLPIVGIDVVTLGAFAGGVLAADYESKGWRGVALAGLGGYVLGGPIVHYAAGRDTTARRSFALRVGAPLAGLGVGALVGGVSAPLFCHQDGCGLVILAVGGSFGFLGGLLVGSVVDIAVLARKPVGARQLTLSVLPTYTPTTGQTGVALLGAW